MAYSDCTERADAAAAAILVHNHPMSKPVSPIPEGYRTLTPYLVVSNAKLEIEFLQKAFGAKLEYCSRRPTGEVMHASLQVGTSKLMLGQSPDPAKALPAAIYMYIEDVDACYRSALEAGGKSTMEPANQFYGDRNAGIEDPNGITWWLGTHVEDVPPDELDRRIAQHRPNP
jgi:uncharacterized glyoxalase superfamily protein PhnB